MPSPPVAPTLAQIQSLYASTKTAAGRFTSYNFHSYFLRRTDEIFRPVLASLESPTSSSSSISIEKIDPKELARFYEEQSKALDVIRRAAEVNRLFDHGDKLVIELPDAAGTKPENSGGGADDGNTQGGVAGTSSV